MEAQDKDKRSWRSDRLAFDTAREAKLVQKETDVINMDNKMFELEVERTRNLGNMTTALMMLVSSMDALTRSYTQSFFFRFQVAFKLCVSLCVSTYARHYARELDNSICPPLPFGLQGEPSPRSQGPWVSEA
jgi:hypothetical protein